MKRSLEEILSELYLSNIDIIGEGMPAWANAQRSVALENLNLLSLPDAHDERYRHSDMQSIFEGEWETYFIPPAGGAEIEHIIPTDGYAIDVVNGFCKTDGLVTLDNGIAYGSLKAAMSQMTDVVSKYYNKCADNSHDAVTALNTVFVQDGAFVYVPANVQAQRKFNITFAYRSQEQAQRCFSRALVIIEDGAKANIVIAHQGCGTGKLLVDHVRESYAGDNSSLRVTEIASGPADMTAVTGSYLRQNAGSNVGMVNVWLQGGITRANMVTDLVGAECESNLYGLYFAGGSERIDINMDVNHLVSDCHSSEMIKGVVSGEAVGAFTGRVYVAPDAQHTEAFQQSRNIQLSETSKVFTEPQLEIYADDVKCSHGATVGQMDEDAVYYMRQRGISEEDARRLQLFGFVNDVISRCPAEESCECLARLAQERIDKM